MGHRRAGPPGAIRPPAAGLARRLPFVLGLLLPAPAAAGGGGAPGLRLVGDARSGEAALLAFGALGPSEVLLTGTSPAAPRGGGAGGGGGGLELLRGSSRQASFTPELASLPRTELKAELAANSLSIGGVQQWALWSLDTFDAVEASPWSQSDRGSCGSVHDQFLGGHCRFGASATARRYEALPPHTKVRVRARVHYIDDWNGESVMLQVDNRTVWAQSHQWCPNFQKWMCDKFGINSCGRGTPDRLSVKAEASLAHTASSLEISFASNLAAGSDACHASWGVDDVSLELI